MIHECKHGLNTLDALQILPQWPQLDLSPSGPTRPSTVMPQQQQPGSLSQGMALPQAPLPAASALSSAMGAFCTAPAVGSAPLVLPAPASLPGTALPQPRATQPAAQQPAEPCSSSAHLPESMHTAVLPGSVTMPQQAAAHAKELLLDNSDAGVRTSARGGSKGPCDALNMTGDPTQDPSNADLPDEAQRAGDPDLEQAGDGMMNAGSQSELAASVSARILGGDSTAAVPDKQQGAPAHAQAEHCMYGRPADASSAPTLTDSVAVEAGRAPGAMPADNDISKPVGRAEASKLIGVRDDLDQLGPAQPNVPCCSSIGAHDESLEGQSTEQQQQKACTTLKAASAQQLSDMPAWQPELSHSATAPSGAAQAEAAPAGHMHETHTASRSGLQSAEGMHTVQSRAGHGVPRNGISIEEGLLHGLHPPQMLQQLGAHGYPECSAMQQTSALGLFDPTASLGQGHSPAANGFETHGSPARTTAGKTPLSSLWHQHRYTTLKLTASMHSCPCTRLALDLRNAERIYQIVACAPESTNAAYL